MTSKAVTAVAAKDTAPNGQVETADAMSVTIKYGKGYEETWVVFHGNTWQIRADLIATFGINVDFASGLTLHELVVAATHVAHGTGNVAAILGGTPIGIAEQMTGEATGADAWKGVEGTPLPYGGSPAADVVPANPNAELIGLLEGAATTGDLKAVWATHQAAFSDKDVKAAYSIRGKALKAAEKAAA